MEKKVDIRFQVPVEFREKMRKHAAATGQTIPGFVRSVVVMYMEQKEVEDKIPAEVWEKLEKKFPEALGEIFKNEK